VTVLIDAIRDRYVVRDFRIARYPSIFNYKDYTTPEGFRGFSSLESLFFLQRGSAVMPIN